MRAATKVKAYKRLKQCYEPLTFEQFCDMTKHEREVLRYDGFLPARLAPERMQPAIARGFEALDANKPKPYRWVKFAGVRSLREATR